MGNSVDLIAGSGPRYVNLETYRRDGRGVRTPLWCAVLDGTIVAFTNGRSGKIKRLRRESRVALASCDARGGIRSPWVEGSCEIVADAEQERLAYDALQRKYGWLMRLTSLAAQIGGRRKNWKILRVRIVPGTAPTRKARE